MDHMTFLHNQRQNLQTPGRKYTGRSYKDLWVAVQGGSVVYVGSALMLLKKNGGNINSRNTFGLTPLLIATWRNHIPIIKRLLAAGADPNARDGESGWSSLHRALHFGHLAVAGILLKNDASVAIEDSKSRTPVDFLSEPVLRANGNGDGPGTLTSMPLKSLCEKAATEHLVEPISALQLLEIADSLEAHDLNETFCIFVTFL